MGADGHWLLMKREDWKFPEIKPEDCGIQLVTVLGVEVLAYYWDTDGREDSVFSPMDYLERVESRERQLANQQSGRDVGHIQTYLEQDIEVAVKVCGADWRERGERAREAHYWFTANAEDHTVWT